MNSFGRDLGARLRFWWADHQTPLGLALAVALAGALFVVFALPLGSTKIVTGTIEGFGLTETDTGSYTVARVRLSDREATVILPRTNNCSIGSTAQLQKQERIWGPAFTLDWNGCTRGH